VRLRITCERFALVVAAAVPHSGQRGRRGRGDSGVARRSYPQVKHLPSFRRFSAARRAGLDCRGDSCDYYDRYRHKWNPRVFDVQHDEEKNDRCRTKTLLSGDAREHLL